MSLDGGNPYLKTFHLSPCQQMHCSHDSGGRKCVVPAGTVIGKQNVFSDVRITFNLLEGLTKRPGMLD